MARMPPHRIGLKGAEELSAVERTRLELARHSRLEPHFLGSTTGANPLPGGTARSNRNDLRNPQDLHDGIDVTYLPEAAFSELFKDLSG